MLTWSKDGAASLCEDEAAATGAARPAGTGQDPGEPQHLHHRLPHHPRLPHAHWHQDILL